MTFKATFVQEDDMGSLKNPKHEAFAAAVARGENTSRAYILAGYQPCRQNASRLSSHDDIKQRVVELKSQRQIDSDQARDKETGRFLQGNSGNPIGRPRGSRNKLGEQFIVDLHEEWGKSGKGCLERVARDDPVAFVRVVAGVLPREIDQTLSVDIDLFAECRSFAQAFRLARDHIGADAPLLIEAEDEDVNDA